MSHTLVEVNGRWVHSNWLQPAFGEVLVRWKRGTRQRPEVIRSPRIVEPTLASLRGTGR